MLSLAVGPSLQGRRTQWRRATVSDGLGAGEAVVGVVGSRQLDGARLWSASRMARCAVVAARRARLAAPRRGATVMTVAVLPSVSVERRSRPAQLGRSHDVGYTAADARRRDAEWSGSCMGGSSVTYRLGHAKGLFKSRTGSWLPSRQRNTGSARRKGGW